jgi:hypothetical protein
MTPTCATVCSEVFLPRERLLSFATCSFRRESFFDDDQIDGPKPSDRDLHYFDNDQAGYAAQNALTLKQMVRG